MLTKIELSKFKSFNEKQTFNLAPITLIYGPNSSGKSSILQSLLLIKQTMASAATNNDLNFNSESISLGSFKNTIHKHDIANSLDISIEYQCKIKPADYLLRFNRNPQFGVNDTRRISFKYKYLDTENIDYLSSFSYSCIREKKELLSFDILSSREFEYLNLQDPTYYINDSNNILFDYIVYREKLSADRLKGLQSALKMKLSNSSTIPLPIHTNHNENKECDLTNSFMGRIFDEFKYEMNNIEYLGPLRSHPQRFYSSQDDSIFKFGRKNIGNSFVKNNTETSDKINYWFDKFKIPYTFNVRKISADTIGDIIALELIDSRNNTVVSPVDVGFGISQVLPIISESIMKVGASIFIEQPEIHLHPRLQAHLSDLFIETHKENQNQYIIETHSESILLRLQKRIKNKEIDSSIVKILYIDAGENGAIVNEIPLDSDGDFMVEWPDGFFEERIYEKFGF